MPVKQYNPTTAGRRISSVDAFSDVTKKGPEKKLTVPRRRKAGRNSSGKITVRHQGGGAKRRARIVDAQRDKFDVPARVLAIEYDPNRGARLALLQYADGEKRYIVAPAALAVGETIVCSKGKGEIKNGNRFPLEHIPVGITVFDVELAPGKGGQIARGAGAAVQLMAVEGAYATLKLPSGEMRLVPRECMATIGSASNPDRRLIRWGKAGRMRHRGIRPSVRGKVMNPVDHPHGGGEGRNSIGLVNPKTPQGKPALGVKTRRKQASDKFIVQRRPKGRFVGA
ncbi:50S ribosomal protein L2 [Candidatus Uhrbacteria bacterium RIFCSPHIGHO2_01_FULL_63_20]|uniref:Large ribosomal subunit protein uL2 n=1 Tax=Candidatus Uhrbacteria bacterium RIFCSPHIGHO2_01_FULL_63_20 TaxID=1802385 RepID=A0A1F7TMH7_9BACT|nr:MAG: 50S ribosomal protein L2 [Candidatus Uhrbacteria bacterium RIFCSPHIGHO2_01_FULL_63_20]